MTRRVFGSRGAFLPAACPECVAGKHGNCDGTTWDFLRNERAACPCDEAGHEEASTLRRQMLTALAIGAGAALIVAVLLGLPADMVVS